LILNSSRLCTVNNDRSLKVYQQNGNNMERKLNLEKVHSFEINDVVIIHGGSGDIKVATGSGKLK
jgi:hypothetical protein